jgi:phage/plasmid primase-like uncharacterized protein/antirestriction protein ArdC
MAAQKMFVDQFADRIVDALEKGNAPWQKEWKVGEIVAPSNPVTGKRYTGVNLVTLMSRQMETGSADPRYMTGRQARDNGLQVRDGAKGAPIQYWQIMKKQERPLARVTTVFHASEIDGMPPWQPADVAATLREDTLERVEKMLRNSKVNVVQDQKEKNRPFYSVDDDSVHISPNGYPSEYGAAVLRGLVDASGHPERMNRPRSPKGSEAYAQEKLRTEIASWMLAADMGLPFEPSHQGEVSLWVDGLKKDPHEIMRACRDAEKIAAFVKGLEHDRGLDVEARAEFTAATEGLETAHDVAPEPDILKDVLPTLPESAPSVPSESTAESGQGAPEEKTWLNVPYTHRYLAKNAGAKWDGEAKLWYAPAGSDLKAFERWMPENPFIAEKSALSPQEEFARALRDAGLDLKGQMPLMDGQLHRVPLLDSTSGKLNGTYKGFLDGIPAGYIENWKTGEKIKWKYSGHMLSGEQIHKLRQEAAVRREAESRELDERHDKAAKRCFAIWKNCEWANRDHPYLAQKQVPGIGVKVDAQGNLIVPGRNVSGTIRTILTITPELKKFEPGAEVKGAFHLIDPDKKQESKNSLILIAEGYATAASVHMGTGLPVVCAFNTNNLMAVAKSLREKYPDKPIVFMADNDHQQEKNPGITKAWEAAKEVNGKVVSPEFTPEEKAQGLTDFNDLHVSRGLNAVFEQTLPLLGGQVLESSLRDGKEKVQKKAEKKSEGMSR